MAPTKETADIVEILARLSQKWTLAILHTMCNRGGSIRFSELKDAIPNINATVLSQRLSMLEAEGLIVRTVEDTKPIGIQYTLTEKAQELKTIFVALGKWADRWSEEM